MAAIANSSGRTDLRDFTLKRLLEAPRPLVFRAFIAPERMKQWWVPRGFMLLSCAIDLREGGTWRMRIRSDQTGAVQTELGLYREIREPEPLAFTPWVRGDGSLTPITLLIVDFRERQDRTEVSFRQEDFATAAACRSHEQGWATSLAQLTDYLGEGKPS